MGHRLPILFTLIAAIVLIGCADQIDQSRLEGMVTEVEGKYAPDHRLEVWNISAGTNGAGISVNGETTTQTGLKALKEALASEYPDLPIQYNVLLLPDPALGDSTKGIVRVSVAHVRREPSHGAELINQTTLGAGVDLLKTHRGYYYARMEDGYLGWISRYSVVRGTPNHLANWTESPLVIYKDINGRIFSNPDNDSVPVSDIVMGSRLKLIDTGQGWVHVELPDGRRGFVSRDAVYTRAEFQQLSPQPEHLVDLGKELLGVSYTWGGTTTNGLDCSGFTQTVFKMNGVQLPRDANMQVAEGTEVDTSENFVHLRPGDLLFFGRNRDRITHVGMYIGDREFIHESGMVKINSLDPLAPNYNARRHKYLQVVKRIF